jgi:hypothetical protein
MAYKTGDIIKTDCHIPFCYHLAICVVDGNNVYVYNNTPVHQNEYGGNIILQPINDFIDGDNRKIFSVKSSNLSQNDIINYVNNNKSRVWDSVTFNCETMMNEMLQNGDSTTQLTRNFFVISILAILLVLISKNG